MVYSLKKIQLLTRALLGDKKTYSLLLKKAPEYAALGSALVGSAVAMNWLMEHNKTLAVFADAVDCNKTAIQILLKEKQFELAAVANMLNDDDKAELWLEQHNLKVYIDFAVAIQYALDMEEKHNLGGYFMLYG
jgi:hypothetical protein